MYRCSVKLSVQYDGQNQSESEHASLIDEHDSFKTDPICVLNTGFDCMINTLVQFCSETLPTQPSVRYARFQHWICSSGSTGEHNLSKKAARWNLQFDIGKQRRNALFRFMNTLVQFCGKHFRVDFVSWICSCLTVFLNIRIRRRVL